MSYRLMAGYFVLAVFSLVFLVIAIIVIRVVTLDTPSPPAPKAKVKFYVVQQGDSLAGISESTNVPVETIERLNPTLDPLALLPGTKLRMKPITRREKRRAKRRLANRPRRYVVKPGEGLLAIADKTHVTIARLRRLNPNKNLNKLTPGMVLRLRRR
jgi:LysM repeat protein